MTDSSRKPQANEKPRFWLDLLIALAIGGVLYVGTAVTAQWRHPMMEKADIDLSLRALPRYCLLSMVRGWIAYICSLLFTVVVASWAFYDEKARKFVVIALDILQSLPVTTFLAVVELAMINLFPRSNTGLELACVFVIFTGQVWNMTFSYYDSLLGTPADFRMLARLYNFNWWHRFWRVELPFGAQGLLYNSMVSMAGGWFFLTVTEVFTLGNRDFRLPGIGSYMAAAMDADNHRAQIYGVLGMSAIVLIVDRLVWRPLVVWSRKFKMDDFSSGTPAPSPMAALGIWFARSRSGECYQWAWRRIKRRLLPPPQPVSAALSLREPGTPPPVQSRTARYTYNACVGGVVLLLAWGAFRLAWMLTAVHGSDWTEILHDAFWSFLRVFAAVIIGTLWTVPFGIWIGLNPKLSAKLEPITQFVASFPAPMIYPWLFGLVAVLGGTLQWGSILLILFGTQWYILFNVAGGAAAIPNDIISCAELLRLRPWTRWTRFLIPAVLPSLVTGWITAAGGAWNATIVSEAITYHGQNLVATGLGAYIQRVSATEGDLPPQLFAAALVMALIVITVNRSLWKRIAAIANERCRFLT